jgi:hypothetical protein
MARTSDEYCTSSEKGGRYVGWHINQGEDRAAEADIVQTTLQPPPTAGGHRIGEQFSVDREMIRGFEP